MPSRIIPKPDYFMLRGFSNNNNDDDEAKGLGGEIRRRLIKKKARLKPKLLLTSARVKIMINGIAAAFVLRQWLNLKKNASSGK